ncbi:tetratricopeptide repeat protein [Phaeovulum sp.]|uniref:tetratricopeptide repeat protein n=1 Tax=Phaeovulum sp. TaxID=2934796 RepID=UPI0039E30350
MSIRRSVSILALVLAATMALSGCDSAEERAEAHFQSGMALLADGDTDRALLEFRNVFKLNGQHRLARETYARIQRERGVLDEAYSQYLRLVEQYPDDLEGRSALGEMALDKSDWPEATRHIRAARELAPDDTMVIALNAALDYRQALVDKDPAAAARAAAVAQEVQTRAPDNAVARRVIIDALLRDQKLSEALTQIDAALERDPTNLAMHQAKLKVLAILRDSAAMGTHLQEMVKLFPDNTSIRDALIVWFVQTGNPDGAETFLRSQIATAKPEQAEQAHINLVQFLRQAKGTDAARNELVRLISEDANVGIYRSLLASIDFDNGDTATAISAMETLLKDSTPGSQTNGYKATLARMLEATGNHVGARARIEEVLADDPTFVPALKMRAGWLITDDRPGEAIAELRRAMDQDPRDPEILTLMAKAHLRDGSRELAGERLAVAVELSGQGSQESRNYAEFLLQDNRLSTAESVLIEALRRAPTDINLLSALGDIYLRIPDLPRADGIEKQLQAIGTDEARFAANRIQVALLLRQQRVEDSIALLQQMDSSSDGALDAPTTITSAYLQDGKPDSAASYLDGLLATAPQDPKLRFLRAQVDAASGNTAEAETQLQALLTERPGDDLVVQALYGLLSKAGRPEEADQVLEAGLREKPDSVPLLLRKSAALEAKGNFEGAIEIYETLYEGNSANVIIANNLASLIANHRDDEASLSRAYTISRRLRGLANPAFQDTLGWIEYRRGNFDEAAAQLEPAAKGMPDDPVVHLHLGLTYVALKQIDAARNALTLAIALAKDSPDPQFARARQILAELPDTASN